MTLIVRLLIPSLYNSDGTLLTLCLIWLVYVCILLVLKVPLRSSTCLTRLIGVNTLAVDLLMDRAGDLFEVSLGHRALNLMSRWHNLLHLVLETAGVLRLQHWVCVLPTVLMSAIYDVWILLGMPTSFGLS